MKTVFCFIPAKLGSIRLPRKNIRLFQGKEMLGHVIDAAHDANIFGGEVIVSTESSEIREVALKFNAKCPYDRNPKLAKDPYQVQDVLLDFFDQLPAYKEYETVCLLLPTSPLNDGEEIRKAYETFRQSGRKGLWSVCEMDYNGHRSLKIESEVLVPLFPRLYERNSKDLPKTFKINGAIAFLDVKHFLEIRRYLFEDMAAHVMPFEKSIDVDTERDARLAEFFMNEKQ